MKVKYLLGLTVAAILGASVYASADQSNYPPPDQYQDQQPDDGYQGPPQQGGGGPIGGGGCYEGGGPGCNLGCVNDACRYYEPGAQAQGGSGNIQVGNNSTVIIQVDPRGKATQALLDNCYDDNCYQGVADQPIPWQPIANGGWGCSVGCRNNYGMDSYYWMNGVRMPLYNSYVDPRGYTYYMYNNRGLGRPLQNGYGNIIAGRGWATTPQLRPYVNTRAWGYAPRHRVYRRR